MNAIPLNRSHLFDILKYLGHNVESPAVVRLLETYRGEWVESNQLPSIIATRLSDIRREMAIEDSERS